MDPCAIYVNNLPRHLTYAEIKDAFWPYQTTPKLDILKKENYLLITFKKEETVKQILNDKDHIRLKGEKVTIKPAIKKYKPTFVHIPPSFFLPPDVLFPLPTPPPPPCLHLVPPFVIPGPPPPAPAPQPPAPTTSAAPTYQHPFPEGCSYFFYK